MARKLKAENHADTRATYAEIEVLGNIDGSTIRTIRASVNSLQQSVQTQAAKTDNYWRDIASDNIVTPTEKKTLKKEFQTITQTYSSLLVMAEQVGVMETQEIIDYIAAYQALYNYLSLTLKLFDNMGENTTIPNVSEFNRIYDTMYETQTKAQNRVVVMQPISIRKLDTLDTPGLDGEIALYKQNFYIYTNNTWNPINKDEYRGVMLAGDAVPDPIPGTYFLNVSGTAPRPFTVGDNKLLALTVDSARTTSRKFLMVNDVITPGSIFLCNDEGVWTEITNKDDWHYVIAMNDLLTYNFQLSPKLQAWLDQNLETVMEEAKKRKSEKYLGAFSSTEGLTADTYISLDWFTWAGTTTTWEYSPYQLPITLRKGQVYKFNNPTWTELNPNESKNDADFMAALADIVDCMTDETTQTGYFATVFAKKFMTLQAVIDELSVKFVELAENGKIKSKNFREGNSTGFELTADGIGKFNRVEVYGEINFQRNGTQDEGLLLLPLKRPSYVPPSKKGYIWIE